MIVDLSREHLLSGVPSLVPGIFAAVLRPTLNGESVTISGLTVDGATYPDYTADFMPGALNYTSTYEDESYTITLTVNPIDMITAQIDNPIIPPAPVVLGELTAAANGVYHPEAPLDGWDVVTVAIPESHDLLAPDMSQSGLLTANPSGVISAGSGKTVAILDLGDGGGTLCFICGLNGSMPEPRFGHLPEYPAAGMSLGWFPNNTYGTMYYARSQGLCVVCAKTTDRYFYFEITAAPTFWATWTKTNPMNW